MTQRFETTNEMRVVTRCAEKRCDLCAVVASSPEYDQWEGDSYRVSRTAISCEEGSSFPEGRTTETISFDVCPSCFHTKLVPFMEMNGARATKKTSY